jgi:uncharacterized lipoprotein YehR (DUF1307 family)
MKGLKRAIVLPILALVLVMSVASCGKSKVKKNIEGVWTAQTITEDSVNVYQAGSGFSIVWTFADGVINSVMTYSDGTNTITETDDMVYEVIDKETIFIDGDEFTINELTTSKLVLEEDYDSSVSVITFTK